MVVSPLVTGRFKPSSAYWRHFLSTRNAPSLVRVHRSSRSLNRVRSGLTAARIPERRRLTSWSFQGVATASMMNNMTDSMLVGASTSLDNLTVGLALGLTGRDVPLSLNLQIALANAFVMAVAMAGGEVVGEYLPGAVVTILPGMVFITLGIAATSEFFFELNSKRQAAAREDAMEEGAKVLQPVDQQLVTQMALLNMIDFQSVRATVPLTLGMCINNAGGGVAAGMANMNTVLVSGLVGMFSIGFFGGGLMGGQQLRSAATQVNSIRTSYISLVAGCILVFLGVIQLTG